LVTEDVIHQTVDLINAESMVDQTKMTEVLKPMLSAQENHGNQSTLRQAVNSELPEKVGLREDLEVYGDH
jgi:hypothetical protein